MARITKPQEQRTSGAGGGVSPSAALSAGLSGSLGNVQKRVGDEIVRQGLVSLAAGEQAAKNGIFTNSMTDATLQFNKRLIDRQSQKVDADGNPMYGSLVKDVGQMGEETIKEFLKKIKDPEVRTRFEQKFRAFVSNKQIMSMSEARREQIDFARASLTKGIDGAITQAALDDPDNMQEYLNRISASVDTALASGSVSAQEATALKKHGLTKIKENVIKSEIKINPGAVLTALKEGTLEISEESRQRLTRMAEAAVRDQERAKKKAENEERSLVSSKQKIAADVIEEAILEGTASEEAIEEAEVEGKITLRQKNSLVRKLRTEQSKGESEAEISAGISSNIKEGHPLLDYTPKQIGDHYKKQLKVLEEDPETGEKREATLTEKATIASGYKGNVKPFVSELDYSIMHGRPEQAEDALRAYQFMIKKNGIGLSSLSKTSHAIASSAMNKVEFGGASFKDAIRISKDAILNVDPDTRSFRATEFNKAKKFKIDRIERTITDMFDVDAFLGVAGKKVSPNVVPIIRNLLKDAFMITGDEDDAMAMVKNQVDGLVGVTEFNEESGTIDDEETFMFFPPEKMFPGIDVDDLKINLRSEVESILPEGMEAKDVMIESDELTRNATDGVTYALYTRDENGIKEYLVDPKTGSFARWKPDHETLNNERRKKASGEALEKRVQAIKFQEKQPMTDQILKSFSDKVPTENFLLKSDLRKLPITPMLDHLDHRVSPAINTSRSSHTPISIARSFLGAQESNPQHAKVLSEFFKQSAGFHLNPANTPWCAAFANSVLEAKGITGTGSLMAKSFLSWGTKSDKPVEGDIAVFHRGANPAQGHVGFVVRQETRGGVDGLIILGGNQSDQVRESFYPMSRLAGVRKAPKVKELKQKLRRK